MTECKSQQLESCVGEVLPDGTCLGGGGNDPGYPYPGGGGEDPQPEPYDPCEKMKAQNTNANYKAKIKELDKPAILKLRNETGYSENKNGTFTELSNAASTDASDAMILSISPSTKGYIHTHQNDYPTGNYNDNGDPEIRQTIKMFSPADVEGLMTMAGFVTNGDYSELYGTMISSYGNYTIKFTGTAEDIKTGFDTKKWRDAYIDYRKEYSDWSFERLFLTFLKDKMDLQGVELYKIKDNGTIQKKTLNSNNKVDSNDCPQ
ncbi:hypothetical protein [uncultured Chryseobacterium sp.]|uniref:hypothetical protein n=1 Tax=uncultured Chryseobacterium sp. TaxID=259322 RepID=UPI0025F4C52D|nr:hypothetical protein [uncultured Chryseobacterium sp.]